MPTLGILFGGSRRLATSTRLLCVSRLDRLTFRSMKDCYALLISRFAHDRCSFVTLVTPGVLESISPKRLFALTSTLCRLLANRSVPIESPDSIDCQAVIREITHADHETPADLLDAICFIDELANAVAVELLLDRVPATHWVSNASVSIRQQTSLLRLG